MHSWLHFLPLAARLAAVGSGTAPRMEFSEIGANVARLSAVIGVGRLAAFVLLPAALRTVSGGQASSLQRPRRGGGLAKE